MPFARPIPARTALTLAAAALLATCGGDSPTDPPGNGGNGDGEPTPTGVVSGSVLDADGEGVAGVSLRLAGDTDRSATTDPSGDFSFASVPVGAYTLTIEVPEAYELETGSAERDVTVTDGGTAEETFALELFEGTTITIVDNAFEPSDASVEAGTEVRWRATTSTLHTVTPDGHDAFARQEASSPGTVLRTTFETPGTYQYFCEPHRAQGMEGQVTVN